MTSEPWYQIMPLPTMGILCSGYTSNLAPSFGRYKGLCRVGVESAGGSWCRC